MFHSRRLSGTQTAVAQGYLNDANPAVIMVDLDYLQHNIHLLTQHSGFPDSTFHTVAIKANPVGRVLDVFRINQMGAEVASMGELQQALHLGFSPERIVFDSPAKTVPELRLALREGVHMNLDNFQEVDRVAKLLSSATSPVVAEGVRSRMGYIGLRVNPQVGAGSIAAVSTAAAFSKFGVPLSESRQQIIDAYLAHPWLNALHLHVGSQGCPLDLIVNGVERVHQLLLEINTAAGCPRVQVLDIGGGIPVDYSSDPGDDQVGQMMGLVAPGAPDVDPGAQLPSRFSDLATLLRSRVPDLFQPDCPIRLVTENGRSLLAQTAFAASRVEYTKSSGGRSMAVVHFGADLLLRTCYLPSMWPLRVFVCDTEGTGKDTACEHVVQDVMGPLCFQGDCIASGQMLPRMKQGDIVVVADVGAYTLSMFSKYNSRCSPPVVGYRIAEGGRVELELLRRGDTLEEVLHFWNKV